MLKNVLDQYKCKPEVRGGTSIVSLFPGEKFLDIGSQLFYVVESTGDAFPKGILYKKAKKLYSWFSVHNLELVHNYFELNIHVK